MKYKNTAIPLDISTLPDYRQGEGTYGFTNKSIYLLTWSGLLQTLVSLVGTKMLDGKFHTNECGIYKCEGGCKIYGVNDLVLLDDRCYWDYGHSQLNALKVCSDLITCMVLEWNPMEPIDSMIKSASDFSDITVDDIEQAIENCRSGGAFCGNALSSFFDWNPFSPNPQDNDYLRWCKINIMGEDEKEVDQFFGDKQMGVDLLDEIQKKCREGAGGGYVSMPLCCSPNRNDDGVRFWINTGRSTQIDGWKTEAEIREFLKSDGKLVDTARY